MSPGDLDGTPSHVGHRAVRIAIQSFDGARHNAETIHIFLCRRLGQQLHAEANAQHRLLQATYDVNEPQVAKPLHCIRGSSHAGQDDPIGPAYLLRIGRQPSRAAEALTRVEQGRDIGSTAIDYGDFSRHLAQCPLGRGQFRPVTLDSLPQGAAHALETGLDHVMRVLTVYLDMQRRPQRI